MTSEARISLITPTCDRQAGIELAERWVAQQSIPYYEWVVADGGKTPAKLTMGQTHLHKPSEPGSGNLGGNVLRALGAVSGDVIVVIEDDDHYAPEHLATCVRMLEKEPVCGSPMLQYFNLKHRRWWEAGNRGGAALSQTAFHAELIPLMRRAAKSAVASGDYSIDARFWRRFRGRAVAPQTVIGIKGLPGTSGLGVGHRPTRHWTPDPEMKKLREWIGDDAAAYMKFVYHP